MKNWIRCSSIVAYSLVLHHVQGAGSEEVILVQNVGLTSVNSDSRISYQCTFRNLWIKERQPVNYPAEMGRWNGPVMWTGTLQYSPWTIGATTTKGVEIFVEDGFTDTLMSEFEFEQDKMQTLGWSEDVDGGFFVSEKNFVHLAPIQANKENSYLTLMAGLSPSPDWFTGLYHHPLVDEFARTWYDHIKFQAYPFQTGTDAGMSYASPDANLAPALPATQFTPIDAPPGGELRSPDGSEVPVVAELECFLVLGEENMRLPGCDWFANPCCNETNTVTCAARLPHSATPEISEEYRQVLDNGGTLMGSDTWNEIVAGGNGSGNGGSLQGNHTENEIVEGITPGCQAQNATGTNATFVSGSTFGCPDNNLTYVIQVETEESMNTTGPPIADEGVDTATNETQLPDSVPMETDPGSSAPRRAAVGYFGGFGVYLPALLVRLVLF